MRLGIKERCPTGTAFSSTPAFIDGIDPKEK
jgi:hypothetical protein